MKTRNSHIMIFLTIALALFLIAARPLEDVTPPVGTGPAPLTVPVAVGFALTAAIGFLISNGLKSFSQTLQKNKYFSWFPDLSGLGSTLTATIVTTIILFANAILAAIPPESVPTVTYASMAIGAALATFGIHFTLKKFQPDNSQLTSGTITKGRITSG